MKRKKYERFDERETFNAHTNTIEYYLQMIITHVLLMIQIIL